MAAATLPSTGPCGRFPCLRVLAAAERALGLSPASLEEEEGEEEEEEEKASCHCGDLFKVAVNGRCPC